MDSMSEVRAPLLYSFRRCPYAIRARWTILVSGQTCVMREIVLRDKPTHMLALSPKGTVPVLQLLDETVLEESLEIMHWALQLNDPENWLAPDTENVSAMLELVSQNDDEFKVHLDRYKYATRYEDVDPIFHRTKAEKFLTLLETRLQSQQFLFGARRVLADIAIAPFVRQFAITDRAWFDTATYPKVREWLHGLITDEEFARVMTKYEIYQPGVEPVFFPKD